MPYPPAARWRCSAVLPRCSRLLCGEVVKQFKPMPPGDVDAPYADTEALRRDVGFGPRKPMTEALARWAGWYRG